MFFHSQTTNDNNSTKRQTKTNFFQSSTDQEEQEIKRKSIDFCTKFVISHTASSMDPSFDESECSCSATEKKFQQRSSFCGPEPFKDNSPIISCTWWQGSVKLFSQPESRNCQKEHGYSEVNQCHKETEEANNFSILTVVKDLNLPEKTAPTRDIGPQHSLEESSSEKKARTVTGSSSKCSTTFKAPKSFSDSNLKDFKQINNLKLEAQFARLFQENLGHKTHRHRSHNPCQDIAKLNEENFWRNEHPSNLTEKNDSTVLTCVAHQNSVKTKYGGYFLAEVPFVLEQEKLSAVEPAGLTFYSQSNHLILFECFCEQCKNISSHALLQKEGEREATKEERKANMKLMGRRKRKTTVRGDSKCRKSSLLCFLCGESGSESSSSGGSDTEHDDEEVSRDREEFLEHGDGGSEDEDSDGGSDSGTEESIDSAELFDNFNLVPESKEDLDDGNASDGPDLASDNSDSLTELQAMRCKRGKRTDDEDDDATDDDYDDVSDWWETLTIYDE